MSRKFCIAGVLLLFSASLSAADDPFAGVWKLIPSRSSYPAGTCPKSMVIEMRPAGEGVWYHSDASYGNGGEIHAQYTAKYDGKPVIVIGDRGLLLPVSLNRVNSRKVVASYSRGMQVVATSSRVLSGDGRTMTITTTSMSASGRRELTIGLYRKQ